MRALCPVHTHFTVAQVNTLPLPLKNVQDANVNSPHPLSHSSHNLNSENLPLNSTISLDIFLSSLHS